MTTKTKPAPERGPHPAPLEVYMVSSPWARNAAPTQFAIIIGDNEDPDTLDVFVTQTSPLAVIDKQPDPLSRAHETAIPLSELHTKIGKLDPSQFSRAARAVTLRNAGHVYSAEHQTTEFVPGNAAVPVSGRVYGKEDVQRLVDSSLDFWLTTGRFNTEFEKRFAEKVGARYALTVNSGSSANLLAVSALCSSELGEKGLRPGDEVLTVAAGFPTTVNPLIQNGLVPVFVDVDLGTYNANVEALRAAVTPKTKAIILAHTLGNPFDLDAVVALAREHGLWLIEDCCDALGTTYNGTVPPLTPSSSRSERAHVGTFGHIATFSFYPAHHITMGEGGAVATNSPRLRKLLESIRDWGRDCWCPPGHDDTCGKRFGWQLGSLPAGYDHKYTYSNLGYNLKITDMQAAVGVAQLDHLDEFIAARRVNFKRLHAGLSNLSGKLILPRATQSSDPSWFGFPITIVPGYHRSRNEIITELDKQRIGTRLLFGGNLTRQPYMAGRNYVVRGSLENTDTIMNNTFWIGVYPGLSYAHIQYVVEALQNAFAK